jgi:uncharacterized membrane protein YhaH (DUF805 family)
MEMMFTPLRKYADFSGRAQRREFWLFFLFQFIANIIFGGLMIWLLPLFPEREFAASITIILFAIYFFAMIIPNAAVIVRRFHDQDIPGWVGGLIYASILIFSFISLIVVLIFMCIDGKRGPNKYGPDPQDERNAADIFG